MKKSFKNSAISALGLLFVMVFSPLANATENPFGMSNVATDMQVATNDGDGKCGDSMKKAKKSGKCGDSMKKGMNAEEKSGHSMKNGMKEEDGKCGAAHMKKNDSKCGGN
jgi:uncharacterized low-complexity protein